MATRLFFISLLCWLAVAQDTCPDFVTDGKSKSTCANDYECIGLCCENSKCNTGTCGKPQRDECPTLVAQAKKAEEERIAKEKAEQKAVEEAERKMVMVIWLPIAGLCFMCLVCSTICGVAANKYLDMEKEKQPIRKV